MKTKVFLTSSLIFFCVIFLATCDYFATINQVVGGYKAAVRVNNGAAGRSVIGEGERIEFYIKWLGFRGRPLNDSGAPTSSNINIVMNHGWYWLPGHSEQVYQRHNEDWYTPDSPYFQVMFEPDYGVYNLAILQITAMRIGDNEYLFTNLGEASYGKDTHNLVDPGEYHFPDAFGQIRITPRVSDILTVLDVNPSILECWEDTGILVTSETDGEPVTIHQLKPNANPYAFITVVGTVN